MLLLVAGKTLTLTHTHTHTLTLSHTHSFTLTHSLTCSQCAPLSNIECVDLMITEGCQINARDKLGR